MRLFIAVQLSDGMNKALLGLMHELKKQGIQGNYIPGSNLHMTLAFIGETDRLEDVKKVIDSVPAESFRMTFSEYGYFGDLLWIGVKGNQKMKKCAAELRKGLKEAGLPCDDEKFLPHITLLRKLKGKRPGGLKLPEADMTVKKISLMKSVNKDGKTIYKEVYARTIN